jgi:hypothetical protein
MSIVDPVTPDRQARAIENVRLMGANASGEDKKIVAEAAGHAGSVGRSAVRAQQGRK